MDGLSDRGSIPLSSILKVLLLYNLINLSQRKKQFILSHILK